MKKIYLLLSIITNVFYGQISQVKDIFPGINMTTPNSGNPSNLFDYNGTLLFRATDGIDGVELWKSDGTNTGTVMVKNINTTTSASGNSNPSGFILFKDQVYFNASTGTTAEGQELWRTDGTNAGTVLVKDINAGTTGSNPTNFAVLNPNTLLFSANGGTSGVELWKTDGTNLGTVVVSDYPGTNSMSTNVIMNGIAYQSYIADLGRELYKSDGTSMGSSIVKDINVGTGNGINTELFVASNNLLYFAATDGTTGTELWKSDGTNAGTVFVKEIQIGNGNGNPRRFVEMNGLIYFNAAEGTTGTGVELWRTDGTTIGTSIVTDINPTLGGSSNPDQLSVIDNVLYFFAQDDGTNYDFYKYDGTTLTKLADLNAASSTVSTNYIKLGTKIFFTADSANDADTDRELWVTDGTPSGTVEVASLIVGSPNPKKVNNLTLSNNKIFFTGELTDGVELFVFTPSILSNNVFNLNDAIQLYPNPSSGIVNIQNPENLALSFEVIDITGKTIDNGLVLNNQISINGSRGIYFVKLTNNNNSVTKKVIKL